MLLLICFMDRFSHLDKTKLSGGLSTRFSCNSSCDIYIGCRVYLCIVCTENMYYELFMMIPYNEELKLINDFGRTEVM